MGRPAHDESPRAANAILSSAEDTDALVGTLHSFSPFSSGCQVTSRNGVFELFESETGTM